MTASALSPALLQSSVPGIAVRHGKVRDVYDFGDRLLIVATDRISAFDWVLPSGIPDKGRELTQLSAMWFARLKTVHHLLDTNPEAVPLPAGTERGQLREEHPESGGGQEGGQQSGNVPEASLLGREGKWSHRAGVLSST